MIPAVPAAASSTAPSPDRSPAPRGPAAGQHAAPRVRRDAGGIEPRVVAAGGGGGSAHRAYEAGGRLAARLAAVLPALAVGAGGWTLAAFQPAASAPETRYLALVGGLALGGAALLAPARRGAVAGAALATLVLWVVPAGPGRGVLLSLVVAAALLAAGWRRLRDDATVPDLVAWVGGTVAVQALLRPAELLPAALDLANVIRLGLPPLLAAVALALLARHRPAAEVMAIGVVTAIAAAGFTATAALPLFALALAAPVLSWRTGATAAAAVGERSLLALGALVALPLLALRPAAGALAAIALAALALPPIWALVAAALPLVVALALGRDPAALAALWMLPWLVPAAVIPGALLWARRDSAGGHAGAPGGQASSGRSAATISRAAGPAAFEVLPGLRAVAATTLLAAGGLLLLPGAPGVAAGAALLAFHLVPRAAGTRVQLPWSALLLAAGIATAAYPWLRREPLVGALSLVQLPVGWGAAAAAVGLVALGAATSRLQGASRRWAVAGLAVVLAATVVGTMPPRGRELLRGRGVQLATSQPVWRHSVGGGARGVRVETLLAAAAALPAGTPVATVTFELEGRSVANFVLRAGYETGEWAVERPDLRGVAPAGAAPIAWLPPPGEWFARAYRASWRAPRPLRADALRVALDPSLPPTTTLALRRVEILR